MADSDEDGEWRFAVEDVGPEADAEAEAGAEESTSSANGEGDNIAGEFLQDRPVEPQAVSAENALFVALGVYIGILGMMLLFVDPLGFGLTDIALVTGGVAVGAALLYALFDRAAPET